MNLILSQIGAKIERKVSENIFIRIMRDMKVEIEIKLKQFKQMHCINLGEWQSDLRHGFGSHYFRNGDVYVG